jgi:7,8-dihydropterin-6-yl-methyl-4-(beta-D-ribofuranosyl)aminobenzene 5'-phosphate synthase
MKFNIIFDNVKYNENLQNLWGFSCLIKTEQHNILFDTGSNGRVLLQNAKKMGIDFKDIDILFISHSHWDHIGGIDTVIEENPNITLIIPNTLSKHFIKDLKTLVKKVIIIDKFTHIIDNLYSTGIMGKDMKEHSLIIEENTKLFIISGCSHSGIDNIEKTAIKNLKRDVKFIIGGFHLMYSNEQEIKNTINNLTSKYITATHCTGEKGIKIAKEIYQDRFITGGAGAEIEIN